MNFEAVIGLEIHVELKTKTKMFSSAPVAFGKEPNSCCMPLDLGFPGTLPTVNKEAVIYGIRVANALHMDIDYILTVKIIFIAIFQKDIKLLKISDQLDQMVM